MKLKSYFNIKAIIFIGFFGFSFFACSQRKEGEVLFTQDPIKEELSPQNPQNTPETHPTNVPPTREEPTKDPELPDFSGNEIQSIVKSLAMRVLASDGSRDAQNNPRWIKFSKEGVEGEVIEEFFSQQWAFDSDKNCLTILEYLNLSDTKRKQKDKHRQWWLAWNSSLEGTDMLETKYYHRVLDRKGFEVARSQETKLASEDFEAGLAYLSIDHLFDSLFKDGSTFIRFDQTQEIVLQIRRLHKKPLELKIHFHCLGRLTLPETSVGRPINTAYEAKILNSALNHAKIAFQENTIFNSSEEDFSLWVSLPIKKKSIIPFSIVTYNENKYNVPYPDYAPDRKFQNYSFRHHLDWDRLEVWDETKKILDRKMLELEIGAKDWVSFQIPAKTHLKLQWFLKPKSQIKLINLAPRRNEHISWTSFSNLASPFFGGNLGNPGLRCHMSSGGDLLAMMNNQPSIVQKEFSYGLIYLGVQLKGSFPVKLALEHWGLEESELGPPPASAEHFVIRDVENGLPPQNWGKPSSENTIEWKHQQEQMPGFN